MRGALGSGLVIALAMVAARAAPAAAATVRGTVYVDLDGDGLPTAGEPAVPGAVVAWNDSVFARADAQGQFTLTAPDTRSGEVWVRVPDGYVPGPVWQEVPAVAGEVQVDLGVRPLDADQQAAPTTFVVAADSHMQGNDTLWSTGDLATAIEEATTFDPPPRFFTIVGDLTQANQPAQFDQVAAALDGLAVPFVPVPGNHDWYDGGATYRARYGPSTYSFDAGGVHFVVWNSMMTEQQVSAFLTTELSYVDPGTPIVALGHAPPGQAVVDAMLAAGVDYLFCGHWHANRVVDHGGLLELDTETFVMGSMDMTPAGYRVVTIENGQLRTTHHTVVDRPLVELVAPRGGCGSPAGFDLVVAAEVGAGPVAVTAAVDGGAPMPMTPAGGWDYRLHLALAPGRHEVHVVAGGAAGQGTSDDLVEVCARRPVVHAHGAWPGLQGGPTHLGARADELEPPLTTAWTATVGGNVQMGAPVIADRKVFVTVTDLARGDTGGVVALDLDTGAERWRWTSPIPVRNAPAVADHTVVVSRTDGTVVALDEDTGAPRWSTPLGAGVDPLLSALWASPTIADGAVFVGIQRDFAALDLATGAPIWELDPVPDAMWQGTYASAAVGGGVVVDTFNRALGGVGAWDQATGDELWRLGGPPTIAIEASPVIVGDTVYLADGRTEVTAVDLATGTIRWSEALDGSGFDWGYAITGTPAYADGRLFVPLLYHDLVALDAATGVQLWRHAARPAPIHLTHYRGRTDGFLGSPLVTGGLVWIAGADGTLEALDAATGRPVWTYDLGVPVTSGLAVAGDFLVVASFDGTVRALTAPGELPPNVAGSIPDGAPTAVDDRSASDGCCQSGSRPTPAGAALVVLVAAALGRGRRRPRRRA